MADKLSKGRRIPHAFGDPEEARRFAQAFNSVNPLAAMRADAAELTRLRALLAAYGRAIDETARVRRDPDRYLDAAAAECEAEWAVRAEAAKWREWG